MSTTFLVFLAFFAACATMTTSTYLEALGGCVRAGLIGPRSFMRVGVPAVLLTAFACLFGPAQSGLVYFFAMAASAIASNSMYVVLLGVAYGLDERQAKALQATEQLNRNALQLNEWTDAKKLQVYLDRTYGRGKVSAEQLLAEKRKRKDDGNAVAQPT
jgi:hypothetical protein